MPSRIRHGLLKLWRVRGGGFYGLGYVIAFVVLEIQAFFGNFEGDGNISTMIVQEVVGFLFRFASQSFLNGFLAFGWPLVVVDHLGNWGVAVLAGTWFAFDRWGKPWINARVPGLAVDVSEQAPQDSEPSELDK